MLFNMPAKGKTANGGGGGGMLDFWFLAGTTTNETKNTLNFIVFSLFEERGDEGGRRRSRVENYSSQNEN